MARVRRPPMFDVETIMTRMGYYPGGPFGPNADEDPMPAWYAKHRAYDRRSGNFQAWGWVCVFRYYVREEGWGMVETLREVGIADDVFENFVQTTLDT